MLNAICVGCSKLVYAWQGGFSPGNARKKNLSHAGSHMSMYMQKHASIRHTHSHSVCVQDCLHLKAVVKKTAGH